MTEPQTNRISQPFFLSDGVCCLQMLRRVAMLDFEALAIPTMPTPATWVRTSKPQRVLREQNPDLRLKLVWVSI